MKNLFAWLVNRFELSRGDPGHNILSMEGLRGFAVFMVFLVHYGSLSDPFIPLGTGLRHVNDAIHHVGNNGVDLFFVLSGYLIYGSLIGRARSFWLYMLRRVQRIYPAFIVVFAVYLALSFAFPAENKIPPGIASGGIYLAENILLLPGLFPIDPMIAVAWTLSYEMFYYLAIPLLIGGLGLRHRQPSRRIALFIAIAAAMAVICMLQGGPIRLVMFIAGILLFEVLNSAIFPEAGRKIAVAALGFSFLVPFLPVGGLPGVALREMLLFAAFFCLCHACFHPRAVGSPGRSHGLLCVGSVI